MGSYIITIVIIPFMGVALLAPSPETILRLLGRRLTLELEGKTLQKPVSKELGEEIANLIQLLGAEKFSVREGATNRLGELGIVALPQLRAASEGPDSEVRRRAHALIDRIEEQYDLPKSIRHNDAEFTVITSRTWTIPNKGEQTQIRLGLQFKNCGKGKIRFYLFDTIHLWLRDTRGEFLGKDGGRVSPARSQVTLSPILEPGAEWIFWYSHAKLGWRGNDLRLIYVDRASSEYECVKGLSSGKFYVGFHYISSHVVPRDGNHGIWAGEVSTYLREIDLK
jgi:hypothetical protein